MKNTLIVCCFPSCGRTYLSTTLANHLFSTPDGLQAYTFSNFEKGSVLGNTSTLVDNIVSKIGEVDFILTGMDEDILQELDRRNLQFVIVVPNASRQLTDFEKQIIKQQWFGRMVMRQNINNPLFSTVLELMKSDYDRMTSDAYIHKYNPINVVRLYESQYLSTVIEKLYAYKEKLANGLDTGKGQGSVEGVVLPSLESGVTVTGATLLTVEEANQLPVSILNLNHPWWLRSPGYINGYATRVDDSGSVDYSGSFVGYDDYGIRPALDINLESSNLSIGDKFTFGDKEFEVVFKDKALCTDVIDKYAFRENWGASNANDYEASDVKKLVDAWYENYQEKERVGYVNATTLENGITVTGATLLTTDEAEQLPKSTLNIYCMWWLIWLNSCTDYSVGVSHDGHVYHHSVKGGSDVFSVRPVLNINLESSYLNIGDRFTFGDKTFEIISNDKALCTDTIGKCAFHKDYKTSDANDYEASDVKKFVDEWYEKCLEKEQVGRVNTSSEFDPVSYIKNKLYDKYYLLPEASIKECKSPHECEELILSVRRFL